ncbi:MAG: TIGR01777 family protein, partial [Blastocatellia bacterium]
LGEMGDALLLDSTRVVPKRLLDAGYEFRFSDLKAALENALR